MDLRWTQYSTQSSGQIMTFSASDTFTRADYQKSDGLSGAFWTAPLDALATAEIGAVRSGGAGGSGMRVDDAWLMCEYE